ncbi:MAG: ZIP family metal transporter [Candidatus ainarchaeum sp.]|nr:ZIP family metal transporter [Candidatus ainarchaeum sp.]
MVLEWIVLATIVDSLVGLIGIFTMKMSQKNLDKILFALVGFSAGALLSGAFFHLLAESIGPLGVQAAFIWLFVGFILFFFIERVLHWHHCHEGRCETHPVTYLIVLGDGIHNFIDGLVIAASFLVSLEFGAITTAIIIAHEVPQELGNFAVLVHGGFDRAKALTFTFVSQLTCVAGGIIGFLLAAQTGFSNFLLPFAAGGFIYIAASDLIPELHKETDTKKLATAFAFFIIGVIFLYIMKVLFE